MYNSKRRHADRRKMQQAIQIVRFRWEWQQYNYTQGELVEAAKRIHNDLKDCSCPMCGNQRQSGWLSNMEKLTMPERKNLERFKDYLYDI